LNRDTEKAKKALERPRVESYERGEFEANTVATGESS